MSGLFFIALDSASLNNFDRKEKLWKQKSIADHLHGSSGRGTQEIKKYAGQSVLFEHSDGY